MNVCIETYGCSANQNNAEIIAGILARAGFSIVNEKDTDLMIINTCIVKGPTMHKIYNRIKGISERGGKKIIIAGCMADIPSQVQKIKKLGKISFVGSHHIGEIAKVIDNALKGKNIELTKQKDEVKLCMPKIKQNNVTGITQILEGCLGNCNYCMTRFAKGQLFSYPKGHIIKNIKEDLNSGCREIWITSQDNAAYGIDNNEKFTDLLKEILKIKGKFFIRIGMMNPNHVLNILDKLIECCKDDRIYKFLHLPLQSGSDKVLKDMRRKYKIKDFLKIISKFRKHFPELTLATDIICGYPTETEEDFRNTLEMIRKIQPDIVNISKYWPMPGTDAAKLKQLSQETIMKRSNALMKLFDSIALEKNKKLIGREYECLVNKKGFRDTWLCRNKNYKLIAVKSNEKILGKIIKAKIKKAMPHYMIGDLN